MLSESDRDPISALQRGQLNIHCSRMELVQNTPHQPIRYVGSGYIRQKDDGNIEFTIYATEIINVGELESLSHLLGGWQSGTLFRTAQSYTLIALSYWRYNWRADGILNLSVDWRQSPQRVSGNIRILRREGKASMPGRPHRIIMHFFDDIDVPYTAVIEKTSNDFDGAVFDAADNKHFCVQKRDHEMVVDITSEVPFVAHFDVRVVEALSYVLARSMSWRALHLYSSDDEILQLSSPYIQSTNTKLERPLLIKQIDEHHIFWRLFSKYLEYVIRENATPAWHKCSCYVNNACEASANSGDAWTIALCVAVEKLSGLIDYVERSGDKKQKTEIQRLVRRWLKSKGWDETTVGHRANGLLSSLNNARVKDRLGALVNTGNVDPTHITSWSKLRNPSVHADERNFKEVTTATAQKWLNDIGAVTVLMYHLTFYFIGYTELYTDYSKPGWPSAHYPLSVTAPGAQRLGGS